MTERLCASDRTGRSAGERASHAPARRLKAALTALGLAALLFAAAAVSGEAPAPPETAPPQAAAPKAPAPPETAPPQAAAPKAPAPPAGPDAEATPDAEAKPDTEAKPDAEASPGTKAKPDTGAKPATGAKPDGKDEPEEEPMPRPVPGEPLRLNFKEASLHAVLEYLSEAAGLIIIMEGQADGRVTVMSHQPISTEEAIALLDTVLKEKGYAAIRNGRTLKIVTLAKAVKENIPVQSGSDPSKIPSDDRLVTQIIPVRFADATRLKADLTPLLPATAALTANQASNTLVLVDAQANVRRVVEIIQALDSSMAGAAEVKVFQLKYANATNAAKLITDLFKPEDQQAARSGMQFFPFGGPGGPGGRGDRDRGGGQGDEQAGRQQKVIATADDRTNTLVVSASPDTLKIIEGVIKDLDSNPTEEQSVFTYDLKNADAKKLETVLNQIFSESGYAGSTTTGAGGAQQGRGGFMQQFGRTSTTQRVSQSASDLVGQVYVVADVDTNALLVRTATKHFERVKEIIADLDRAIRQVLIKVLIAEVTHQDDTDIGTEFSVLNLQFGATVDGTVDMGTADNESGGLVTANMTAGLAATFNALQHEGRLDVLSRPYILASDNQEATITVGQEVPFITNSRTTETGQTINTIEYQDVGIILKVTPHVNPQGLVIMDVAPEISAINTDTTVRISETVNATVYNKRSADTHVAIRNGQTIVIGGLMEDRVTDATRKVPGLGDIPILGKLFQRVTKQKIKTELLIFLTPHVAEQPELLKAMSEDETAGLKAVREAGGEGLFEEHMESMKRGAMPTSEPPAKEKGAATTPPSKAPAEEKDAATTPPSEAPAEEKGAATTPQPVPPAEEEDATTQP